MRERCGEMKKKVNEEKRLKCEAREREREKIEREGVSERGAQ